MHCKTTAYSQVVLLVHELRLPCGTLLLQNHCVLITIVHSLVNQLDDHNSEVFVMYFRDIGTDVADYDEDESEPPLTDISILRSVGGEVFGCAFYK